MWAQLQTARVLHTGTTSRNQLLWMTPPLEQRQHKMFSMQQLLCDLMRVQPADTVWPSYKGPTLLCSPDKHMLMIQVAAVPNVVLICSHLFHRLHCCREDIAAPDQHPVDVEHKCRRPSRIA